MHFRLTLCSSALILLAGFAAAAADQCRRNNEWPVCHWMDCSTDSSQACPSLERADAEKMKKEGWEHILTVEGYPNQGPNTEKDCAELLRRKCDVQTPHVSLYCKKA
ncbi:hypothetical protein BDV26DRAFT_275956 [Aspergillus bertholletiae]|uniref:Uncharacterized protein n=1 Tax=Aspergillus bertholletiae TaxID=1226010 RepID=A0A5N7AP45_9EURO|nr:hypothetical protein BDV26DRAFT_275956 [Aspergillus bertholletiae]